MSKMSTTRFTCGLLLMVSLWWTAAQTPSPPYITDAPPSPSIQPIPYNYYPCPICDGGGSISNPNSSFGNINLTCDDIDRLGQNSSFDSSNCAILRTTDIQTVCGCSMSAPSPAPILSTCKVCGFVTSNNGSDETTITTTPLLVTHFNPTVFVPGLGNITCGNLQEMGISSAIEPSVCSTLPHLIHDTCGCQPLQQNTGGTVGCDCHNALTIGLGDVILGQIYHPNASSGSDNQYLAYCSFTVQAWTWYRFTGVGGIVTAHTCQFSAIPTQVIVLDGNSSTSSSCSDLLCSVTTYDQCDQSNTATASGTTATWFAELGVEYRILVSANVVTVDAPIDGSFALTVAPSCNLCGVSGTSGTTLESIVNVPSFGNISCFALQRKALFGSLDHDTCANVQDNQAIQQACGCESFVPGRKVCLAATSLHVGDIIFANTAVVTRAADNLTAFGTFPDARAWFRFQGTGDTVTASTCSYVSDYYNGITLFDGTCEELDLVDEGQPGCDTSDYGASLTWNAISDQEYFILVSGDVDFLRSFALTLISEPPAPTTSPTAFNHTVCSICGVSGVFPVFSLDIVNVAPYGNISCGDLQSLGTDGFIDAATCAAVIAANVTQQTCGCYIPGPATCENATTVSIGEPLFGGVQALVDAVNYTFCGKPVSNPVWYHFVGNGNNVSATVQNCYADVIVVGGSCADPVCIGIDASSCDLYQQHQPEVTWHAMMDQPYYILISTDSTYSDAEGDFVITVSKALPAVSAQSPSFPQCNICGSNAERVALLNVSIGGSTDAMTCS